MQLHEDIFACFWHRSIRECWQFAKDNLATGNISSVSQEPIQTDTVECVCTRLVSPRSISEAWRDNNRFYNQVKIVIKMLLNVKLTTIVTVFHAYLSGWVKIDWIQPRNSVERGEAGNNRPPVTSASTLKGPQSARVPDSEMRKNIPYGIFDRTKEFSFFPRDKKRDWAIGQISIKNGSSQGLWIILSSLLQP